METKPITQSILLTIKKMLGIAEEYHAFDIDVITHINAALFTLNELGVGPDLPYTITGEEETWSDFLGEDERLITAVPSYVYFKVRLMFDPPTNSFLTDSIRKTIDEYEWRFIAQKDCHSKKDEELTPDEKTEIATKVVEARFNSAIRRSSSSGLTEELFDIFSN